MLSVSSLPSSPIMLERLCVLVVLAESSDHLGPCPATRDADLSALLVALLDLLFEIGVRPSLGLVVVVLQRVFPVLGRCVVAATATKIGLGELHESGDGLRPPTAPGG